MSKLGVASFALAVCLAGAAAAQDDGVRMIEGSLEAPTGAGAVDLAVVEARDGDGRRIAEAVFRIRRGTAPFPFIIAIPSEVEAELFAGLFANGAAIWTLGAGIPLDEAAPAALNPAVLTPFADMRITTAYRCGDLVIEAGYPAGGAVLRWNGSDIVLGPVRAASGARYESEDGAVSLWSRGNNALIAVDGDDLPECSVTPPAPSEIWYARGNEPGWTLSVSGRDFALLHDYGAARIEGSFGPAELVEGVFSYASSDGAVSARIADEICRDDATGMPYPQTVRVGLGDRTFRGCGGRAAETLAGQWRVTSIGGVPVDPSLEMTLVADADGNMGGGAGCNRYATTMEFGGESVAVGPIAATRMACPDDQMRAEQSYFATLAATTRFDLDAEGSLLFFDSAGAGPILTFSRIEGGL